MWEKGNKDKRETPVGRLPFCGPMRASAPTGRAELAPNTCIPGPRFGSSAVDNDSARTKGGNSCHPGKYSAAGSGRKSRIPVRLQFHIYLLNPLETLICQGFPQIKCSSLMYFPLFLPSRAGTRETFYSPQTTLSSRRAEVRLASLVAWA